MNEIIAWLVGTLLIPLLLWLISPEKFKSIAKKFKLLRIDCESIKNNLTRSGLHLTNDEFMTISSYVRKYRYVYFPVVPRSRPSIIHLNFISKVKVIKSQGLKIRILIFDDYYKRVRHLDNNATKTAIKNFVNELVRRGIDKKDIIFESDYLRNSSHAKQFMNIVMDLAANNTIEDIQNLRSQTAAFTKLSDPYIKQQKVFYNIAYAMMLPKTGFVLCGDDEIPLWDSFIQQAKSTQGPLSQLIILSIKKMINTFGKETSIWDEENLCTDASTELIRRKISDNLKPEFLRPECGIFYLLDNLYFSQGKQMRLGINSNGSEEKIIDNIDELITFIRKKLNDSSSAITQDTINTLVECIHNVLAS